MNAIIEFKDLLLQNEKHFNKTDFEYLYLELYNHCQREYDKRNKIYKDILIVLLKDKYKRKIDIHNDLIHEHDYTALISTALRLEEFKLAEDIIINFNKYLLPSQKESVFNFNYGAFYYRTKNYEKALVHFSKVKRSDFNYSKGIYDMQLKIYYETDAVESALNLIDAYKHFLNTSELIPHDLKIKSKKFLKYYEELIKIKEKPSKINIELLIDKINKTKEISYRSWLIEKAKEIKIRKPRK